MEGRSAMNTQDKIYKLLHGEDVEFTPEERDEIMSQGVEALLVDLSRNYEAWKHVSGYTRGHLEICRKVLKLNVAEVPDDFKMWLHQKGKEHELD